MAQRFRGFLPVVIDVETGGFNNATDALLEIAAVTVDFDAEGDLELRESVSYHVEPFEGANIEPASLEVNGIDPHHPLRPALPEREALARVFKVVRAMLKETGCKRAVLVGHNAHFDLGFLNAAIARTGIKRSPFHPFSCFDTATLAGVALGQTVLRRAATAAGMSWDNDAAHSARYDTEQTARLFCTIVNRFRPVYENIPPLPQE
ncbi:ribonuclease T [Endozoicomonas sp. G2_2]|nr:ribonuclease T [Endozoicomonas sp. G2_2]